MKLKTLKDMEDDPTNFDIDDDRISIKNMRQEAIKWIKENVDKEDIKNYGWKEIIRCCYEGKGLGCPELDPVERIALMVKFFNITEENLK